MGSGSIHPAGRPAAPDELAADPDIAPTNPAVAETRAQVPSPCAFAPPPAMKTQGVMNKPNLILNVTAPPRRLPWKPFSAQHSLTPAPSDLSATDLNGPESSPVFVRSRWAARTKGLFLFDFLGLPVSERQKVQINR